MRRVHIPCWLLMVLLLASTPLQGQASRVFGMVPEGQMLGEGEAREETISFGEETVTDLLSMKPGDRRTLPAFPVAPGVRESVTVERVLVYARGTRVWNQRGSFVEEVAPSGRAFYRGYNDDGEAVAFAIDPQVRRLTGWVHRTDGLFELMAYSSATRTLQGVRRRPKPEHPDTYECKNPEHAHLSAGVEQPKRTTDQLFAQQLSAGVPSRAVTGSAGLRQATIAVDTDIELLHLKFSNSTAAATAWLEDLFNNLNVMYERDLGLRLVIGETILRTDPTNDYTQDPYPERCGGSASCSANGAILNDVGSHWAVNHAAVERAFVTFFSGKEGSNNSGSGIAWIDGYCEKQSTGGGYSATQVLKASFLTTNARLIGHEIGHNAGSVHTHCYSPAVDTCYNAQSGCYTGPVSCPAAGRGTVMSYCHFGAPSGASCGSSLSEFHPTVQSNIEGFMDAHPTCIVPLVPEDLLFADGFEAGNTAVWN